MANHLSEIWLIYKFTLRQTIFYSRIFQISFLALCIFLFFIYDLAEVSQIIFWFLLPAGILRKEISQEGLLSLLTSRVRRTSVILGKLFGVWSIMIAITLLVYLVYPFFAGGNIIFDRLSEWLCHGIFFTTFVFFLSVFFGGSKNAFYGLLLFYLSLMLYTYIGMSKDFDYAPFERWLYGLLLGGANSLVMKIALGEAVGWLWKLFALFYGVFYVLILLMWFSAVEIKRI